jgi:hypothetical protein
LGTGALIGDLEAAAADSLAHLLGGKRKHTPEPGALCANCGAALHGHYCHDCGQSSDGRHRSILHLVWEALEATFELDGRLWRTLPALFFRPGKLARDYIDGRLARHVPPFRTFLVALLLFIFAAEHATHEMTVANAREKAVHEAVMATPQGRAAEVTRLRAEAAKDRDESLGEAANDRAEGLRDADEKPDRVAATYARETGRAQTRYAAALAHADAVARGEPDKPAINLNIVGSKGAESRWKAGLKKAIDNPDYYWSVLFEWGHRLAILLLPIVGLSLALVYRKRKEVFVYDHLLVAMNLLSFTFLTNAAGLMLPFSWMGWWFGLVALWTPVNLFQTLRGAYGSSILGAILKTLIVWWITVFSFSVLLTGLLILAVAEL